MTESKEKSESAERKEDKSLSDKIKDYIKNILDFSTFDKKTILYIIIFSAIMVVTVLLFLYMIFIDETFLYRLIIDWVVNPIWLLGFWGIFIFLIVMMLQGIIAPIPSEVVLIASGMIYGLFVGSIMGVIGSMAAGLLCYYISVKGGRPMAEKFIGEKSIELIDDLLEKYGSPIIFIGRVIPFIPFDPISFASGVLEIDAKKYSLATFVGVVPRVIFYCFLGDLLRQDLTYPVDYTQVDPDQFSAQAELFNLVLIIIAVVMLGGFGLIYFLSLLKDKRMSPTEKEKKKLSKIDTSKSE